MIMSCLERSEKNVLVRLSRICPRRFLSFECFNNYSLEKLKACENLCSPSACETACFASAANVWVQVPAFGAGVCARVGWMAGHVQ